MDLFNAVCRGCGNKVKAPMQDGSTVQECPVCHKRAAHLYDYTGEPVKPKKTPSPQPKPPMED